MRRLMADQRERETGATAVIVALCFLLLLGLVGLSIDIGAAFAKRQEMQNAADAAALAVAAECLEARVAANCPGDYAAANEIALLNERTGDSAEVRSGEGAIDYARPYHVTVTVTGEQPHWFLQAVGGEDSTTVRRSATVNFGSPVKGTVTIPIIVSECVFQLAPPELGKTVEIWLPQNATQADNMACGGARTSRQVASAGWLGATVPLRSVLTGRSKATRACLHPTAVTKTCSVTPWRRGRLPSSRCSRSRRGRAERLGMT
jgi:Flp pilus assembly protein TadG